MPSTNRHDPYAGFNFRVEIDGVVAAAFSECCGLSSETEVISYREGGDLRIRRLPGLTKYANLVLKHGITLDRSLWDWRRTVIDGAVQRRNGSVILLDATRKEVARWNFVDAWPAKWAGPDLNAESSNVAIETLEIVHEGLDWVS